MRRTYAILFAWPLILLWASSVLGERGTALLQPGDELPFLAGHLLNGKSLGLPAAARDDVAVVIFSFSRAGGRDARDWAQHLSKDYPQLDVYNAIFLEAVPRLIRGVVVSGIRSGMPPAVQDRTMILYEQQGYWEERLHVTDENSAVVLVLGPTGLIREIAAGPFADHLYRQVRETIKP